MAGKHSKQLFLKILQEIQVKYTKKMQVGLICKYVNM